MNRAEVALDESQPAVLVRAYLEESFGPGVAVEVVTPLPEEAPLHPAEAAAVRTAVAKRRREFAAGRLCARRALARLGVVDAVLPAGPDRAPVWPAGIAGSISHTDGFCVAAVARRDVVRSLGVDAEPDEDLNPDLWGLICTPAERRWLETRPAWERGRLARLVFSAKESFYKLQYPLTRRFLDFQDARLDINAGAGRFTLTLLTDAGAGFAAGAAFAGRSVTAGGVLVTAMALAPTSPRG